MGAGLRPVRFKRNSEDEIRREALERVGGGDGPDATPGQEQRKRLYPSQKARRKRTVSVCFESQEDMDRFRDLTKRTGKKVRQELSLSAFATMLLTTSMQLVDDGVLKVEMESQEVQKIVVKRS